MIEPYYQNDGATIYHGDCREILPHLPQVGAVVTDPPYAIPTKIASVRRGVRSLGDLLIVEAGLKTFFDVIVSKVDSSGRVMVFCDQTSYPVIFRLLYGVGMSSLLVWDKCRKERGWEFRKSHELILNCWFPDTPIFSDGKGRSDVLRVKPVSKKRHPAEKPTALLRQLLEVCQGVVLDPFMGSGSTLRAATDLGLEAIGCEIEELYCEIAADKLRQGVLC